MLPYFQSQRNIVNRSGGHGDRDVVIVSSLQHRRRRTKEALLDTVRMDLDAGPRAKPGYKGGGVLSLLRGQWEKA